MKEQWAGREFFRATEFGPKPELMDADFISKLELARATAGVPFVINSAWRPEDESKAHQLGRAVDIKVEPGNSRARFHILRGRFLAGFRRVGVYDRHIHVDDNPGPWDADVCWLGISR